MVVAFKHCTWRKGPAANVTNVIAKFILRLVKDRSEFETRAVTFHHRPRNRTFTPGGPPWSGAGPGGQRGQFLGNGPGRGARARIPGVSGAATGGEDGAGPGRPLGRGKKHSSCDSIGQYLRYLVYQPRTRRSRVRVARTLSTTNLKKFNQ